MFAFLLNELQHLGQKYLWTWSGWFDQVDCLDGSFAYPAKDKQITGRVSKRLPTLAARRVFEVLHNTEREIFHTFDTFLFFFFFFFPSLYDSTISFFFSSSSPFERRPLSERTRPFDQIVGEINDEHEFILREMIRKGGRGGKKEDGTYYKVSRCC